VCIFPSFLLEFLSAFLVKKLDNIYYREFYKKSAKNANFTLRYFAERSAHSLDYSKLC